MEPPKTESRGRRVTPRKVVAVAAAGIAVMGFSSGYRRVNEASVAGQTISYQPLKSCSNPDSELRIGTWNTANTLPARTKSIRKLVLKEKLDILALQEVQPASIPELRRSLPCYSVSFVLAHALKEGKGNAILSRGSVRDVKGYDINQRSPLKMVGEGMVNFMSGIATANASTSLADNKIVEPRAGLSITSDQEVNGHKTSIQFATGHIGRQQAVRPKQLKSLMGFVEKRIETNQNTIFCGDVNTQPSKMLGYDNAFDKIGMTAQETEHTYVHSTSSIDYCAYVLESDIVLSGTKRVTAVKTDHYLVVADVTPKDIEPPQSMYEKAIEWFTGKQ